MNSLSPVFISPRRAASFSSRAVLSPVLSAARFGGLNRRRGIATGAQPVLASPWNSRVIDQLQPPLTRFRD